MDCHTVQVKIIMDGDVIYSGGLVDKTDRQIQALKVKIVDILDEVRGNRDYES